LVVFVGETVMDDVVAPFDHRYVPPPTLGWAINVADDPAQMLVLLTLTVTGGFIETTQESE
jgi:hypothetical protein